MIRRVFVCVVAAVFATASAYDDGYGDPYGDMDGLDAYGGIPPMMDPYGGGLAAPEDFPDATKTLRLNNQEEIDKFLADEGQDAAVLGYFETPSHADDLEIFKEVGKSLELKFRFAYTTDEEAIELAKYKGAAVVVYKPAKLISEKFGEKLKSRYPVSSLRADSLAKFIEDKGHALVGVKTKSNQQRYLMSNIPEFTLFGDANIDSKMFTYYANRVRKVAKDYVGKMRFNIVDKNEFLDELGFKYGIADLKSSSSPGVGIRDGSLYYALPGSVPVTADSLREFIGDYFAGKLVGKEAENADPEPREHSEDEDADSKVLQLTTDKLNSLVKEAVEMNSFVEFYAPWCGHCKSLRPEYEKLAEQFNGKSNVVIAAMDATAHTPPKEFDVQGFPTIYFIPAHPNGAAAVPVSYEGQRSAKAMADFINLHKK